MKVLPEISSRAFANKDFAGSRGEGAPVRGDMK